MLRVAKKPLTSFSETFEDSSDLPWLVFLLPDIIGIFFAFVSTFSYLPVLSYIFLPYMYIIIPCLYLFCFSLSFSSYFVSFTQLSRVLCLPFPFLFPPFISFAILFHFSFISFISLQLQSSMSTMFLSFHQNPKRICLIFLFSLIVFVLYLFSTFFYPYLLYVLLFVFPIFPFSYFFPSHSKGLIVFRDFLLLNVIQTDSNCLHFIHDVEC